METRTTLRNIEFSSTLPDLKISLGAASSSQVDIYIDDEQIYSETLYPNDSNFIVLSDLSDLVTPYARQRQTVDLRIECSNPVNTFTSKVVYCAADMGDDFSAEDFLQQHFLSILMGTKVTAMGRLEYLHMQGDDEAQCTAYYSDGTTATFDVSIIQSTENYCSLDVSPDNFTTNDKILTGYTIEAGSRRQEYEIDLQHPDCAPILCFVNSFGFDELAYCTGIHKVDPSYKRSMAYVGRIRRNYKIDETRSFKADTGPLTMAMANWWDEVFRSDSVRVVNIYEGNPNIGKDLLITDSKSEVSNDDADMPRFTFTYQYAQRNHNVLQLLRAGRIFDNTFDNTFN